MIQKSQDGHSLLFGSKVGVNTYSYVISVISIAELNSTWQLVVPTSSILSVGQYIISENDGICLTIKN